MISRLLNLFGIVFYKRHEETTPAPKGSTPIYRVNPNNTVKSKNNSTQIITVISRRPLLKTLSHSVYATIPVFALVEKMTRITSRQTEKCLAHKERSSRQHPTMTGEIWVGLNHVLLMKRSLIHSCGAQHVPFSGLRSLSSLCITLFNISSINTLYKWLLEKSFCLLWAPTTRKRFRTALYKCCRSISTPGIGMRLDSIAKNEGSSFWWLAKKFNKAPGLQTHWAQAEKRYQW